MPRPRVSQPAYCLDKSSGRAFVTLSGKRKYLGKHGTPESRDAYSIAVGEWLRAGRVAVPAATAPKGVQVSTLIHGFWDHAQRYYRRPDGTATSEVHIYRSILRPLRQLYGATPAAEFRQQQLKALRERMIQLGWCRKSINKHIGRIRSVFKWGGENLGLPGSIYQDLRTVAPLKSGRTEARETERVKPVPDHDVQAVRPLVSRHVRAMIDVQLLTGMRPGEVCSMRTMDIDRGGKVWIYKPTQHKTAHHGHAREVRLGPRAQTLLEPFLKLDLAAPLFSPAEAEAERLEARHAARKTPLERGNVPGSNRTSNPSRRPANRYTVTAYRVAVARACDRAFVMPAELRESSTKAATRAESELSAEVQKQRRAERRRGRSEWRALHTWHPHQLRHNAATMLRRQYGLEAARAILGHQSAAVTEIYAEIDGAKAEQIMLAIG